MFDKYKVVKSDDGEELKPGTYFVIRDTDVFGSQALYGYAHLILAALELDSLPDKSFFGLDERTRLELYVDDLSLLASYWLTRSKKIPD